MRTRGSVWLWKWTRWLWPSDASAGACDRRAWPAGERALGQWPGVHVAADAGLGRGLGGWPGAHPARPTHAERLRGELHGRLRDECLNASWFRTLNDVPCTLPGVRSTTASGPRVSLDYRTPREFKLTSTTTTIHN